MGQAPSETTRSNECPELSALRASDAFRGPVDPPSAHDSTQHLTLIYETQDEQFAAAIPFIEQGLERGERCLYIIDENTRADVLQAMRSANIDVESALESGALTTHTAQDIYFQDGTFDPDSMLSSLEDTIDESRNEYEGFRATSEMTWVLDNRADVEDVFEYEARVNKLSSSEECMGLCQYNRDRFPPAVIDQAIKTHPHIIADNTVSENIYYTPPEEFVDPEQGVYGVDQKIETLQNRTEAQTALEEQRRFLRKLYDISSDGARPFEEKIEAMLELGCEYFDLDIGALTHLPAHDDDYEIAAIVGPVTSEFEGAPPVQPEPDCFCRHAMEQDAPVGTTDVRDLGWDHDLLYEKYGLTAYFGVKVVVGATPYGTLWFGDGEPRKEPFTAAEYTILELMGQWVSYELERHERERDLRRQHEIAASPTRSFEEKLQALFDLGCDRFDLELGAMARVDPETDRFEIEYTSDEHDHFEPGLELPLSETFWTAAIDSEGTGSVSAPSNEGYADITVYRQFGLKAYFGTHVPIDGDADRTFFFVSSELRDEPFPEEEHTFLQLMGQWVKYELERKQREQQLQARKATLEAQNDTLSRLSRVNALVQELVQALVEEPTRTEIEETVCARLTASDFYQAAWIADRQLPNQGATPRTWSGIEEAAVTALTDTGPEPGSAQGVAEQAIETQEVQVVRNVADEPAVDACRDQLRAHGIQSVLAAPIPHKDTHYGVLVVAAARPDAFDERQRTLFGKFGRTLGFAITAAERKRALSTDEVVELHVRVRDPDHFFVRATAETDATLTLDGLTTRADESYLVYITMTGAPAERFLALAEQSDAVEHARLVEERDEEVRLEVVYTRPTMVDTFAEYGATVTDATATDGEATLVVELPRAAGVRSVVEAFQSTFPDSEVVAKRTVDASDLTERKFQAIVSEWLTDKQREALEAAYFAGYFDRPRTSTGKEVAATLGVSVSTFHQHLRVAERKLTEAFVTE